MELTVQAYLRTPGNSLQTLEDTYKIKARQHSRYSSLWCLKYSQLESDFSQEIVRECRGLILDGAGNKWEIKRLAFHKFFNGGEALAAPIDWTRARVESKEDGSLMSVYWHDNHWEVASSGTADGSGHVMNLQGESMTKTFADLFWETFKNQKLNLSDAHKHLCFSFELCTKENRVLVHHPEDRVVLIGVRDMTTLKELDPAIFQDKYPIVKTFPLQTWDQCMEASAKLNPLESEGYVVVCRNPDREWDRIKHKNPSYVAISHLRDSKCSPMRLMEVIQQGESSEFLAYFPEWVPLYNQILEKFQVLEQNILADYEKIRTIESQKDFALQATKTPYSAALFQLRSGKITSPRAYFMGVQIKNLAGLLGLNGVQENNELTE